MQERLHIDDLKLVEKQVDKLIASWRKLNKDYSRLYEKYHTLDAELVRLKEKHQKQVAQLTQKQSEAEEAAQLALSEAVRLESQRWQQKYDELRSGHEQQLLELNESHHERILKLEEDAKREEAALKDALAQANKVKTALSNRVIGVKDE